MYIANSPSIVPDKCSIDQQPTSLTKSRTAYLGSLSQWWLSVLALCFGSLFWLSVLALCFGSLFWLSVDSLLTLCVRTTNALDNNRKFPIRIPLLCPIRWLRSMLFCISNNLPALHCAPCSGVIGTTSVPNIRIFVNM
jgi:hypothetical protein